MNQGAEPRKSLLSIVPWNEATAIVGVAGISALGYLMSYCYCAGYLSHFRVPYEFVNTGVVELVSMSAALLFRRLQLLWLEHIGRWRLCSQT